MMPLNTIGAVTLVVQKEMVYSVFIIACICAFCVYVGKQIEKADALEKPKGVVLVVEVLVGMVQSYLRSIMPTKFEKNYYSYFSMMAFYLLIANLFGLLGFDAPTSNFSITLAITLITFTLIQLNAVKKKGLFTHVKGLLLPPTELLGAISPLISLSMRLFGNILSGSILMALVYSFTGWLSSKVIPFNFLGPVIAPVLHAYFDVFAGCIQTLIFVTLSCILISIENPDE